MKLDLYLSQNQISISKFTKMLGLGSRASLYRYMSGERMPSQDLVIKIMQLTGNAVTANDFVVGDTAASIPKTQRARWNPDCILSAQYNHKTIYDRDFYIQFLERSAANENITFPLWQALQLLKDRLKIQSNGELRLDGVISTVAQVIAAANKLLAMSGDPLIFYPNIQPITEKAPPNFKILF